MSKFIQKAHLNAVLLGTITVANAGAAQLVKFDLPTNVMYDKITLRTKFGFKHGDDKAMNPKFGGIYNIFKDVCVNINNTEPHWEKTGVNLYTDNFRRSGRENNDLNYSNLPDEHIQNFDYCFQGSQSVLGGIAVPDGAFALDLRHTAAGNQTYNSVRLEMNLNPLSEIFNDVNDTAIETMTIEVWAAQLWHDAQSLQILSVTSKRYAEIITEEERKKVTDTELPCVFNIEMQGRIDQGVYLSDLEIVQVDEGGNPIAFDDENAVVSVKIGGETYCTSPIWALRKEQNDRRIEDVPPNMLFVPLIQRVTGLGGVSPTDLSQGVTLTVKANGMAGQTGAVQMNVLKSFTYKTA